MPTKECPHCFGTGQIAVPIGERLHSLRKERNATQDELAKILGVSRPAYANIEADRQDVSTDKIVILARHYNVSADYLLGLTERRT